MPELETRPDGRKKVVGVVRAIGTASLEKEFITVGETIADAMGRTVIRDAKQQTNIAILSMHLEIFNKHEKMEVVKEMLRGYLNLAPAIGGANRATASMTHSGLWDGPSAGVKGNKESAKAMAEQFNRRIKHESDGDGNGR